MARLFVISGPSGAGKGTLIRGVLEQRPDACLIFIDTDLSELRRRLISRQTEAEHEIDRRLQIAEEQSKDKLCFDHVVHNDEVERAVAELLATLERELDR